MTSRKAVLLIIVNVQGTFLFSYAISFFETVLLISVT